MCEPGSHESHRPQRGKSDSAIVAERPTNKAGRPAEELEERRAETEGNAVQQSTRRAQNRESVSQALDRIRQAARQRKKERFIALLHHISPEHLEAAFYELKENAAPGVDGVTWRAYEEGLDANILDLHSRLHKGEHIERCRPDASTYPNRTVGNAHSRLPPLRTRSSNGRLSES